MSNQIEIPALKVHQWLKIWDTVTFDSASTFENRKKPEPYFLMFTIKAGLLKKLSKVYPKTPGTAKADTEGVQRKHDPERSEEIKRYIQLGYPLSDYSKGQKIPEHLKDLQMPGWLPTAIVANILKPESKRGENKILKEDTIEIKEKDGMSKLFLPKAVENAKWDPKVPPIEIIDGQHRLWAFDQNNLADDFELPVVAFFDLDITWQAYLFYTINVKPKKINRSLAYDLYPLLRVQEWLERSPDTANVYKETRAQEIVERLWSHDKSPWKNKINMIGDTRKSIEQGTTLPNITQAAFIRNLIASFIKTTTTKGLGGLFGAKLADEMNAPLAWNRTQQTAFIIFTWQRMYEAVLNCKLEWAKCLREDNDKNTKLFPKKNEGLDLAFHSHYSLLSSDQGVRGFLHIINDMIFKQSKKLDVRNIKWSLNREEIKDTIDSQDIDRTIKDFEKSSLKDFTDLLCSELIKFDWRSSSEPHLDNEQRKNQMIFKGSSGYKELRTQLLQILSKSKNKEINETSIKLMKDLGYAN